MTTEISPQPKKKRRGLRRALVVVGAVVVVALGIAGWALNRYVVDHVAISDVSAYEAKVAATSTVPTTVQAAPPSPNGAGTAAATASGLTATSTAPVAGSASSATTTSSATVAAAPVTTNAQAAPGVTVRKVVTGTGADTITYYVADVILGDATELRTAFANNKFGDNIIANTSTIAQANNAVFAINGDYYGYRRTGIVIRNGVVYRDSPARQGLAMYRDGSVKLYDEKSTSAEELLKAGVWNTLSFGPGILDGGNVIPGIEQVEIDTNIGNHSIQGKQPRTGIGMISANHLVFVAVDGRSSGYSRGVTLNEFATIFKDLGAQVAYNLDGGGSTTMYFEGKVVNNPLGKGKERGTSDILYIGAAKQG